MKINKCECGYDNIGRRSRFIGTDWWYWFECNKCGAKSHQRDTEIKALNAWNKGLRR